LTSPSERSTSLVLRYRRRCLGRVAQVNDERVEVVGEAVGGGGVAGWVEPIY